jgi:hypothetical protein
MHLFVPLSLDNVLTIGADILNVSHQFSIMVNDKTPLAAARDAGSMDCMLLLSRVLFPHLSLAMSLNLRSPFATFLCYVLFSEHWPRS